MVCSADDLVGWKDFPKGLRVLLLDEDGPSSQETKLKLEAMDYVVSLFLNENDALDALSKKFDSFHVAIVEVTSEDNNGSFRFLEMARGLPTVVISDVRCLSTMMKCIALGAAEFLEKPLSDDKIKNLWQHVVHKAFNAGGGVISKSLMPIKETVVSMLRLESETTVVKNEIPSEGENLEKDQASDQDDTEASDRFPAPSTPQLEQAARLTNDGDFQDRPNCLTEKHSIDDVNNMLIKCACSESKSVDITSNNLNGAISTKEASVSAADQEEVNSPDDSRGDECSTLKEASLPSGDKLVDSGAEDPKKRKSFDYNNSNSHANKSNKKKMKVRSYKQVDWTQDLHKRFVQAVEQLGIDQAIPSKILELMKVDGLTRHNVASHLQKYRMHRRHILPKDDDRRWRHHSDPIRRGHAPRSLVPIPPYCYNYGFPPSQAYPAWGQPGYFPSGVQMWNHAAAIPPWPRPPESWAWKQYSGIHADAWGCPVLPPYNGHYSIPPSSQCLPSNKNLDLTGDLNKELRDFSDFHLAEEVIDRVVKEAMSKPWLPLPLGLKAPCTESVLAELHRQGIPSVPPPRLRR